MPLWESFDHASAEDAYRAARDHIAACQPDDRIVGQADGVYAVLSAAELKATRVATVVISRTRTRRRRPRRRIRRRTHHHQSLKEPLMYTLTIDDHAHDVSTLHDTPEAAQAALHTYLVQSDYYQRPIQLSATHTAFELLALDQAQPRVVGVATIEIYSELDARRDLKAVFDATALHALTS